MRYRTRNRWGIAGSCVAGVSAIALLSQASPASALDARTQQAMIDAINDEYRARAFYTAAIEKFGNLRPFINLVQAEDRHVQLWNLLFANYGLSVPEDTFVGKVDVPDTLEAACQMGIETETANAQMYENFLSFVQEPDLRAAFTRLREVSESNHKPALERCLGNAVSDPQPGLGRRRIGRQGNRRGWVTNAD